MTRPPSEPELLRLPYFSEATGQEREYLVYLPRGYRDDPQQDWPVIVFLHGSGEVGDGRERLDYVLLHGPLGEAWIQQRDLPFIMIGPQLPVFDSPGRLVYSEGVPRPRRIEGHIPPRPSDQRPEGPFKVDIDAGAEQRVPYEPRLADGWWRIQEEVVSMLDAVLADYRADAQRVYLTGLSLGGWGTFELAAAYPERWAAIAPIAGAGDPAIAQDLAKRGLPIWMFAGGRDDTVPEAWVMKMAEAINAAGHPSLRYTVHEEAGHLVWIQVYAGEDLYNWFLQHRRSASGH
jgi:predicted peptidase